MNGNVGWRQTGVYSDGHVKRTSATRSTKSISLDRRPKVLAWTGDLDADIPRVVGVWHVARYSWYANTGAGRGVHFISFRILFFYYNDFWDFSKCQQKRKWRCVKELDELQQVHAVPMTGRSACLTPCYIYSYLWWSTFYTSSFCLRHLWLLSSLHI